MNRASSDAGARALNVARPTARVEQETGTLERKLRAGQRVVIVEARPPEGPDLTPLVQAAETLAEWIDAIQLTDMPFATPHIANWAAGAQLKQLGHEVVLNLSCRDRNTIAQQGTLLGAAALGIQNFFCIRGDDPSVGDHPHSCGVFETSGLQLVSLAKRLRSDSAYASGRRYQPAPALFVGAALAPHARYGEDANELARRKMQAGADFLVTQPLCDTETLPRLRAQVPELFERCFVLAGVGPVTTLAALEALSASSELLVPDQLAKQLRAAAPTRRAQLGMDVALAVAESALAAGAHGILIYPFDCSVEQTREFAQSVRGRMTATTRSG